VSLPRRRLPWIEVGIASSYLIVLVAMARHWAPAQWTAMIALGALLVGHALLHRRSAIDRGRWQQALDAMQAGIVIYDKDDRLVTANADFKRLYGMDDAQLRPGLTFEALLRDRVRAGQVPEAVGREDDWIAERVAQRRVADGGTMLRRMSDGRWRRIVEQRLPDGGMLGFSIDVTELVAREGELEAARARLNDALEALPEGFALYDRDDRFVLCNQRYREMYADSAAAFVPGATFESILRYGLVRGQYPQAAADPQAWVAERMRRHRETDGRPILQELPGGRWLRIDERRSGGIAGVRTDVTEMVLQGHALEAARADAARAEQLLLDAIEAIPAGVEVYDEQDRLVVHNQRLARMYPHVADQMRRGETFESMVRRSLSLGTLPQARGREEAWLAERLAQRANTAQPFLQQLADGTWLQVHETRSAHGSVVGVRLDVTELVHQRNALREANAALEALSTTDALTGLANRRQFDVRLAEEIQRAQRHATPLALLLVDVDYFKRFNDHFGHQRGDEALREVARVLQAQVRRPSELVARYGGEEFALVLPHVDAANARRVAERCVAAMNAAALPHGASPVSPNLTLSVGYAVWTPGGAAAQADALLRRADEALYAAKGAGRARAEGAP
jgi:diguanylate cyclase (GGDEF)-like protein